MKLPRYKENLQMRHKEGEKKKNKQKQQQTKNRKKEQKTILQRHKFIFYIVIKIWFIAAKLLPIIINHDYLYCSQSLGSSRERKFSCYLDYTHSFCI